MCIDSSHMQYNLFEKQVCKVRMLLKSFTTNNCRNEKKTLLLLNVYLRIAANCIIYEII